MQENKIPKIIHYVWFGHNPKGELIEKCIESWKYHMPDYKIIEWNEGNFDISSHPYTKNAYANKKWAFVSDYVRLKILYEQGGIYLDTDMYILKNLDDFIDKKSGANYELVLGKEDATHISAGMIACAPHNEYIKSMLDYYDNKLELITIPRALTEVYNAMLSKNIIDMSKTKVFDPIYFYPYTAYDIKDFKINKSYTDNILTTNAPAESYAVHMWNYSWGHPMVKFVKKIGLHKLIIKILDKLKIKNILKKILKSA